MQPALFNDLMVRTVTLPNRIMVSPMCQYSAIDGTMTSWHLAHLASLALSGAGLLVLEATAVTPDGRISPGDSGLYSDANETRLAEILFHLRQASPVAIGIQIGHAGRKASSHPPFAGGGPLGPREGAWETVAPSPLAFGRHPAPRALAEAELDDLEEAFIRTAMRAARLGFDYLEIHAAHGYLLSQFLSPLSNERDDAFGGSLENRMRFPLRIVESVRAAWPGDKPLAVRINGSDFAEGGWDVEDACAFARAARDRGLDMVTISGGGIDPAQKIEARPGYQVEFARRVRQASGLVTTAVGMILSPRQAEDIVASGAADMVALARALLFDPRWPWHAAHALGGRIAYPAQLERASPAKWPGADELLAGLVPPGDGG